MLGIRIFMPSQSVHTHSATGSSHTGGSTGNVIGNNKESLAAWRVRRGKDFGGSGTASDTEDKDEDTRETS